MKTDTRERGLERLISTALTGSACDPGDLDQEKLRERPSAYVIILGDTAIARNFGCDHGIAAQTILLGATEKGLGGCMIGNIRREELRNALSVPEHLEILLVLALGKPVEEVVIEPVAADGKIRYWRDSDGVHHVPKRALDDIIVDL